MSVIRPIQYPADRLDRLIHDGIIPAPAMYWGLARKQNIVANGRPAIAYSGGDNGITDPNGVFLASGADEARFATVLGRPQGLLGEEERENVILDSEVLSSTTNWTGGAPVRAANVAVAPDGTTTADSLEDNSAGALESVLQGVTIADDSNPWCFSIFIKKDSDETRFPEILLQLVDGVTQDIGFDLNTSTGASAVRFSNGTVDSGVIDAGDYWRQWITVTNNGTGNLTAQVGIYPAIGTTLGAFDVAAVGTTIYWGAQLEQASTPSSYIPTTAAAVTRTADVPSIALADIPGFSTTEGTILVECNFPILTGALGMLLQIDDGTGDNRIYIEKLADETIRATVRASASTTFQFTSTETFSAGVPGKVMLTWKGNDSNAAFNGEIGTTDTGVAIPTGLTDMHIGTNHAGGLQPNGNCSRVGYWPKRLPDQVIAA